MEWVFRNQVHPHVTQSLSKNFVLSHLAVVSGPHATMSIICVSSHLRVHSIIVKLLLLRVWNGVRVEPTSRASTLTRDDTNLLMALIDTSRTIPFHLFQPDMCVERDSLCLSHFQLALFTVYSRWILRSQQRKAAIVVATARERIIAALKLSGHLLVGCASTRHQHHVKTRESEYRYR